MNKLPFKIAEIQGQSRLVNMHSGAFG